MRIAISAGHSDLEVHSLDFRESTRGFEFRVCPDMMLSTDTAPVAETVSSVILQAWAGV